MKNHRLFIVAGVLASCIACGETSPIGPSQTTEASNVRLTNANTLTEMVNELGKYGIQWQSLAEFDHSPADFPAALSYLKTADPLSGSWDVSPEFQYPTPSGRSTFGATGSTRRITYTARDLSNGLVLEGQFQAFWGVKDLSNQNNLAQIPVAIVIEGIVTLDGVPKYRGVQRIVGALINSRFRSPGGVSVAPPTLALSANYTAFSVQTLDENDPRVPCPFNCGVVQYQSIWVR